MENGPRGPAGGFCPASDLEKYDRANGAELLNTLSVYLANGRNTPKTAAALYLHRNTINCRVNHCMEILNMSLDDGEAFSKIFISLKVLEYVRVFGNREAYFFA